MPDGPEGAAHYIYWLDGLLLAEADSATSKTLREYIWLPIGDASHAADNGNEEGATPPPLPVGFVTGVNTGASKLLMAHADHLGRPVRLTDATRATVWSASYDPFGQLLQVTGTTKQNLRFPGQYFLLESGLSYNWNRFYDAATGRYTQPDPLRFVDGPSVYGYASASPMMWVDPEGLQTLPDVLPVAAGAALCDGPFLFGDAIAIGLIGGALFGDYLYGPSILPSEEHTKNARPSTEEKHQKGQVRKGRDQGGERGGMLVVGPVENVRPTIKAHGRPNHGETEVSNARL